ncbi:efflux RND transporter periplasmic adaptor subunit [Petroclostridium xylanilyticum]|uniref:efflux RND transporter periplasmic adaptor subunit n=1 Tax=Petroclostridium xylanilyticum TaxID=1792311 RepID=UPI000B9858BD|nr:efflux RND transporter periplasmic adaptor subunit [Petroclostridium xylanilyticum]
MMTKWKITSLILTVFMTVALFSGCGKKKQEEVVVPLTPVEAYKVAKGDIQVTYAASGRINALKEVSIIPKVPGKVESVLKDIGDRVKEGEILFTLEKKSLYQQLEQLDAQLTQQLIQAEASLKQLEIQYNNAKTDYENGKALYEGEAISKQALDGYKKALELAEVQYKNAQDNYAILQNKAAKSVITTQKEAVSQNIEDSDVRTPISGIVAQKNIEVGEMVSQQMPAYTIVDMDKVVVETTVTERIINKITKGQEVLVTVQSLGGKQFKGVVDAMSPAVTGQNIGYPVKIIIKNETHELKPGMFAEVKFVTDKKDSVVVIPMEAVITRNANSFVFVLEGDVAKKRDVKVGFKDDKNYEIISGLQEGELVIIKGQQFVADGEKVQPVGGAK